MLTIRFNRVGKKNQAYFRIALQEKGKAPGKRHVEMLGSYDPHKKVTVIKKERVLYWMGQGAELSDSVHNLLLREGVVEGDKRVIRMKRPEAPVVEEAPVAEAVEAAPVAEVPAEEVKA
ncbi:MAG: 30S ribosomal protein S16 [Candidatus Moranbacteria bacterium]|nr:30S ribosomal protein S16 [Candidatus Moranbacteria bacterium]MBP6034311.1 30S ribosomal protein S16 [Candidatus Moranbacteria bacterium]MBP7696000.1 30S ribosomal protein S16 [Candidatus Moranbacteria bacterium]